ncbi:hypothetical protein MHH37_19680 [Solibacillus sp. FSL K6-1781]|uniref:hypothetical protein n=1 Tax=Solibacillus sp. FSL K6-1781 TaxID=2921474 RepID=UPI00315B0DB7
MNEIKRQLNKNMGSTSRRAERIISKVNEQKRQKPQTKKSNRLYYVAFTAFFALAALTIFVMKPWSTNDFNQAFLPSSEENDSSNGEIGEKPNLPLRNYFKQDGDVAYFLGTGNEYASFKETTTWLFYDYVEVQEDNGGAVMQKVYRIKQDAIELVYEEMIEVERKSFTLAQLNQLEPIHTILQPPIANGEIFENKTVTYPVNFQTPYKNYDNIIQITEDVEGGKNHFYYDYGDGLIAEQYIMNDGNEITSVLASINEPPTQTTEEMVSFKNIETKQTEILPLTKLTFLDSLTFYKSNAAQFEMTYEPLRLSKYNETEIGVFRYNCDELNCEMAFAKRSNGELNFGATSAGTIDSFKLSPNLERIIFSITRDENYAGNVLSRTMLLILNIETMQMVIPTSQPFYFDSHLYPITHYDWINDTTIQAEVANISDYESETILKWQQLQEKETKVIEVSLP